MQSGVEHKWSLRPLPIAAIVAPFTRKNAANLLTGRVGKPMDATKAVRRINDFEWITWLVIK